VGSRKETKVGREARRLIVEPPPAASSGEAVQMALLPAYSPDLNPVEYLWAWLMANL